MKIMSHIAEARPAATASAPLSAAAGVPDMPVREGHAQISMPRIAHLLPRVRGCLIAEEYAVSHAAPDRRRCHLFETEANRADAQPGRCRASPKLAAAQSGEFRGLRKRVSHQCAEFQHFTSVSQSKWSIGALSSRQARRQDVFAHRADD